MLDQPAIPLDYWQEKLILIMIDFPFHFIHHLFNILHLSKPQLHFDEVIKGNVQLFCCFTAIFSLINAKSIVQEHFCYYTTLKMFNKRFGWIPDADTFIYITVICLLCPIHGQMVILSRVFSITHLNWFSLPAWASRLTNQTELVRAVR